MSKQKRRFQPCVPAESQTQRAAVLLFALQFSHQCAHYWTLLWLQWTLQPGWWKKWKYPLDLMRFRTWHWLSVTSVHVWWWKNRKEMRSWSYSKNFLSMDICHAVIIFRKYFIIIIIAILQSNAEYDYFIQKRSWQGTDMKIREILNS